MTWAATDALAAACNAGLLFTVKARAGSHLKEAERQCCIGDHGKAWESSIKQYHLGNGLGE